MWTHVFVIVVVAGSFSEAFYNPYSGYSAAQLTAGPIGAASVSVQRVAGNPWSPTYYRGRAAGVREYAQSPHGPQPYARGILRNSQYAQVSQGTGQYAQTTKRPRQYAPGMMRTPEYVHASLGGSQYVHGRQGKPQYAQGPIGMVQFPRGPLGTGHYAQGQASPGPHGRSLFDTMTHGSPYTPARLYRAGFNNYIKPWYDAGYGHGGILITYDYPDIPDRSKKVDY